MPRFKTTYNILKDFDEYFDENWMDKNYLTTPENKKWDYSKELSIEDIDIWEVIFEKSGGIGVYAAWNPYAEFYLITTGIKDGSNSERIFEYYYGKGALNFVIKRMIDLDIPIHLNKIWVENEEMWIYE